MPASTFISSRNHYTVTTILALAYLSGSIGLQLPGLSAYFRPLSPVTLISSLVILLLYHTDWRPAFYLYLVLTFFVGYFIEVLGVHTGLVFGHYAYGWGLGVRWLDVPPVIGINWLTLSYCFGSVCDRLPVSTYLKILSAATLMVVLDFFIEPVAVDLDFWTWFGQPVPWQNYLGWWIISLVLFSVWYSLPFRKENRIAKWLLLLQFIFFAGQNLFMIWR